MQDPKAEEIKAMLKQCNPQAILLQGFDAALIGMTHLWGPQGQGGSSVAVYDSTTIMEILVKSYNMEPQKAVEYFEKQIDQVYMGANTPILMIRPDEREHLKGW